MAKWKQQILLGLLGGAVSAVLNRWFCLYFPETDSFADIRDAPAILLAFFVGPLPAMIAGALAALARASTGLFRGIGEATWFISSLATFCAAIFAVVARRFVFIGERPSFALGAAVAAIVEMLHMTVVLTVGFAKFSNVFAVILAAIPFQCGVVAAIVAIVSLLVNRRQNRRENLIVAAVVATIVTFMVLVYFAMERQAVDMADGMIQLSDNQCLHSCHLATVLYGIVLSVLAFAFAAYAKRVNAGRDRAVAAGAESSGGFRVGIRGKFAISLAVMLAVIGGLVGVIISVDSRAEFERGYSGTALFVAGFLSEYIDGEDVRRYSETGRKDATYEDIQRLLTNVRSDTEINYLFVIVPDETGGTYVWDTDKLPPDASDVLGKRELDFEPEEIRVFLSVFHKELDKFCFIHRSETYGHLMSAVAPILGADGKPVALVCVDMSMDCIDKKIDRIILSFALMTLTLVLLSLAGYYFFVSRFIVSPVEQQIKAEDERIHAELNVAYKIQSEAMPNVFPAFPDHPEFDVYAMMEPAKTVGGDFYDFFLVDESHIALVIGDISDKGVPAALFMMTTKTLIRARTRQGGTPAEILRDVNGELCEGNDSKMFATVYLTIIDLATGKGLSANAGHEHPILRRAGGDFSFVKYAHDPMLAICPELDYVDHAFELHPGDTLLVYTDGVPEGACANRTFYGLERITTFLNGRRDSALEPLLKALRADIAAFVGTAPQSDDITMLAFTFKGTREG